LVKSAFRRGPLRVEKIYATQSAKTPLLKRYSQGWRRGRPPMHANIKQLFRWFGCQPMSQPIVVSNQAGIPSPR
jgi:hypothetical protein